MKLWTFQTANVAETLKSGNEYVCNPKLSTLLYDEEDPDYGEIFFRGYDYIAEKLGEISPKPEGVVYPTWSWYNTEDASAREVLQHFKDDYKDTSEEFVLIELEVPNNEVLLSNFAEFHDVLNNHTSENDSYFLNVCGSHDCDEYEYDGGYLWCETHWKEVFDLMDEATDEEKKSSWNKYVIDSIDYDVDFIQACFWKITPDQVVSYNAV